jgi:phosphatidylglycerophosphate synthase
MMQHYSFREILDSYLPEKKAADGPWTRFVLRPLSFPFAQFFFLLGFSPNTVSYISALLSITAFFLLTFGSGPAVYAGFALFFLFGVLDCADGNMARTIRMRRNPGEASDPRYGEWVDAVSGYIAYAAFFLGIGALQSALSQDAGGSSARLWMLAAAIALSGNLLMRLSFQNYRASVQDGRARGETGRERKFSESIGITGILVPLSLAAYIFRFLWAVILLYLIVYCGGFFFTLFKIIKLMGSGGAEGNGGTGDT